MFLILFSYQHIQKKQIYLHGEYSMIKNISDIQYEYMGVNKSALMRNQYTMPTDLYIGQGDYRHESLRL